MLRRLFKLNELKTNIKTELIAGLSTFATLVYVIAVNPAILADAGMDFGAVLVATVITTAFATALMGLLPNFPIAIAPAMGVSAFFTYSIVIGQKLPWQSVLAVVCLVATTLVVFHIFHLRRKILEKLPRALSLGATAGIGLFLACVGLKEVGLIKLGDFFITFGSFKPLECGLLFAGTAFALILMRLHVKSAFILAILLIWSLALMTGLTHFKGIVSLPPSMKPTFAMLDFSNIWTLSYLKIYFSILLVAIFDSCAGLLILAHQAGLTDGGGKILRAQRALLPDALGSLLGSFIGTTILAIHLESSSGIRAGGRSGLTALFVSLLFICCLFFYPLVSSIPHFASASVLIILGGIMFCEVFLLNWKVPSDWVPALLALVTMPLTLSIYNGFLVGFITYPLMKVFSGQAKQISGVVWVFFLAFCVQLGLSTLL
jgi:adenine/guanine/hypoxanthine permease